MLRCAFYPTHRTRYHAAQPSYSSAARSAAPSGAVRCGALLCGAVLYRAALCFLSNIQYRVSCAVQGTRNRYVHVYSSVCFLHLIDSRFSSWFSFFTNCTRILPIRTRHRQRAHNTLQGNQLCASSSWHYQIARCTKPRASSFYRLNI